MTVHRTVGRNTIFIGAAKVAFIGAWIVLTPMVLERLGREAFGFWSLLLVIGGALTFFDLGLTAAVTRTVAQLAAAGAWRALAASVRHALFLYVGFAIVACAVGIALTPMVLGAFHVPEAWQDQAAIAFRLSLACFAVSTVGGVLQAALTGLQRLDLTGGIGVLLSPVLVFLVAFGLRMPSPIVAVLGAQLIHATLTCALLGGACWAVFRQGAARAGNVPSAGEPPLREMVGYGLRVQVGALASFLHMQLDKVLIGAWAGLIWVAPCELGLRVVNGVVSAPQLFLGALLPALADLDARGGRERSELYRAIFEPYVLVVVPLCVGTATLAAPLFQAWLGATRSDASLALRLLMAAAGPALVASVATTLLRAMGRPGLEARYAFLALVMHALLAVVGMRWWGWMGVLVGGALSSALAAAWLVTAAERWLGLVPWRVSLPVLVRATIAAAVAAAATTGLIQLPHLPSGRAAGFAFLAAGGAVFTVAYAVTLVIVAPRSARGLWERLRAAWPG